MRRRQFITSLGLAGVGTTMTSVKDLLTDLRAGAASSRMPSIFIGHGNPMNALLDNAFTQRLRRLGERIERPTAVLVVSAHWLTRGSSSVSTNPKPATIHDFGGFPDELFAVQYPTPGAPAAALQTIEHVKSIKLHADHEMGLDHGAWTILRHIFPKADIPVFQLSIDWDLSTAQHYALATELQSLRDKGILIIGSGNVVHNLGRVNWQEGERAAAYDWAVEFDHFVQEKVANGDHQALINYAQLGALARMAHPTNDHYLPLLYTLGASRKDEPLTEVHTSIDMGSVSMRSFLLG
jgi:4,5-DOPA dioxygenase extradiol